MKLKRAVQLMRDLRTAYEKESAIARRVSRDDDADIAAYKAQAITRAIEILIED